jgi:hypothetical protein
MQDYDIDAIAAAVYPNCVVMFARQVGGGVAGPNGAPTQQALNIDFGMAANVAYAAAEAFVNIRRLRHEDERNRKRAALNPTTNPGANGAKVLVG